MRSRTRPDRRRLAGSVGAEEAEDLALADLEVDLDDAPVLAVRLGQSFGLDDRGHVLFDAGRPRRGLDARSFDHPGSIQAAVSLRSDSVARASPAGPASSPASRSPTVPLAEWTTMVPPDRRSSDQVHSAWTGPAWTQ